MKAQVRWTDIIRDYTRVKSIVSGFQFTGYEVVTVSSESEHGPWTIRAYRAAQWKVRPEPKAQGAL
jgi:hypothetical protein